ncbi:MAG TPA: polysaccharide biosynthesis tyrosine autokinase [Bacteroidales bacterium]|nr:polysaccharide biosynthesis tyrosine autokinase [Bacteroidales bacterium]
MKDMDFENHIQVETEQENNFDIKAEFFKVLSFWKLFAVVVFISLLIAFLYLRYTKPAYKITSTILIKDDSKSRAGGSSLLNELDVFKQQSNLQNEIGILKSKSLSRKTVNEQNLFISYYYSTNRLKRKIEIFDECPFKVVVDTSSIQLLNTPVQINFTSQTDYKIKVNDFENTATYKFSKIAKDTVTDFSLLKVEASGKINEPFKVDFFSFKIVKNPDFKDVFDLQKNYSFIISNPMKIGEAYSKSIEIKKIDKESSIIEISLKSTIPSKAIKYLTALSENYIKLDLEFKNLTATKTINFIDSQLQLITDSLNNVEDVLEKFRSKNKIIDLSAEYTAILTKLEAQDNEKVKTNMEIKYYEYILEYLQQKNEYTDIVSPSYLGISNTNINKLVTELITLATEKNKLEISSTENNPYYTAIEKNIAVTKSSLIEQIKNSLSLAKISLKEINKRISLSEESINKLPGTERDLLTIQRKFNLNDETYSFLMEKKAEASISKASNLSNNMIVDPAELEAQVSPNTKMAYLIALLLGLILPYLFIRIREYLNDSIQSKNDIESQTKLPIIGSIAHSNYKTSLVVIDNPRSIVSETIRSTKANMDFISSKESNIITLTSTVGGEGKTFSSMNLSCAFAISDLKTVLIGCDLRKPKIFNDFNLTNTKGLTSYLIGKCELNEIVNETHINNLHIITAGPIPPNPAELLSSEKMKNLLGELRSKYDYIIIDTPPLGIVTDALFLMKYADINIYVTRFNFTSKKVVKEVNDIVKTTGVKNVCFLINDIVYKKAKYGKYGKYSNKYGYAYTYHEGYYQE